MDNNFNQTNNQNMGQDVNQAQNQYQPQYTTVQGNGMGNYQTQATTNYGAGTVPQKPNILLGTLGALAAAVVGTFLWVLIATFTGYVFFLLGVGIAFLAIFLYTKLAKGIDTVGIIICTVFTCIAIYLGNKFGYLYSIAHDLDCTIGEAQKIFDYNYECTDAFKFDYIKNMVLSYIVGAGYSVAMVLGGFKKKR